MTSFPSLPTPTNVKYYSLTEALFVYDQNIKNWSVNYFYKETKKTSSQSHLYHKANFYNHYNQFESFGITPRILDHSISIEHP